ncbi:MAG: glycine cleavage system protein GcvH [Candidatus Paracaedibacteraceae bacterium]|nr:glycine cleavage system protein GcvH [Candidatus Paracaedibacteraceae bacterium]
MKKYSNQHEWIMVNGTTGIVGISDYAQSQLGDVVFTELPSIGKELAKGTEAAVVESVKAASEIYAPVSGKITEVNTDLETTPDLVNSSPEAKGWFFKIDLSDPSELDSLMDEATYKTFIGA